jgi:hypothetical protein
MAIAWRMVAVSGRVVVPVKLGDVSPRAWRSVSTIRWTSSVKVTDGFQPSLVVALVGSPINKSTSVGRR